MRVKSGFSAIDQPAGAMSVLKVSPLLTSVLEDRIPPVGFGTLQTG